MSNIEEIKCTSYVGTHFYTFIFNAQKEIESNCKRDLMKKADNNYCIVKKHFQVNRSVSGLKFEENLV